jgi:hypothetical protein
MMRVDVDFNERDRRGHVVARVPAALASQLTVGQRVNLYDPPERLWADAVVARVGQETHIAAFDVDWHSFEDAEVADVFDTDAQWSIGVPPTEGMPRLTNIWISSVSALRAAGFVVTGTVTAGNMHISIETGTGSSSLAGLDERAVAR